MLIINNEKFNKNVASPAKVLEDRDGSENDVIKLWETFQQLGYLVDKIKDKTSNVSKQWQNVRNIIFQLLSLRGYH